MATPIEVASYSLNISVAFTPARRSPLGAATIAEFADIIACGARFAISSPGWASLAILSEDFFSRELIEEIEIAGGACPRKVSNELVRVHYGGSNLASDAARAAADEFKALLIAAIGPFIERVGKVAFQDTPEGWIVVSVD